MYGVCRTRKLEFKIGGFKTWIILNCHFHQMKPYIVRPKVSLLLEGIVWADHKPYFIQSLKLAKIVCQDEMTDMNRIE